MKKRFVTPLIVLLIAFVITPLDAQMISAPNSKSTSNALPIGKTNLNLRFGINVSKFVIDETDMDAFKNRLGFHIGINTLLPINQKSGIDISVLYSQRGSNVDYSDDVLGYSTEGFYSMNYLEIPINYNYNLNVAGHHINLLIGPTFGLGINGKAEIDWIFGTVRESYKNDIKFKEPNSTDLFIPMKRLDLGLNFGASYKVKNITAGLTYNIGLTNHIYDAVDGEFLRQRVFQVFVNYPLPHRAK
jgi:hypothetical protein